MKQKKEYLLKGGRVVLQSKIEQLDLLIRDGIIAELGSDLRSEGSVIDLSHRTILPGFIDIHHHGANGFDFTFGNYDAEQDQFKVEEENFAEGLDGSLSFSLSTGTTGLLLTTMAAPLDDLMTSLKLLRDCHKVPLVDKMVIGVNLEGTFLKDPAFAGAQNPAFFQTPSLDLVRKLQRISGDQIRIINIPPDHGEHALEIIKQLVEDGVVIAGGHTGAYGDTFRLAVDAGLSLGVHFLNGPSRHSAKGFHGGGAEEAMLQSDQVSLEIIADGYHVHPAYFLDVLARKGADRVVVITDSMFASGCTGISKFSLIGLTGQVSPDGRYLTMLGKEDTLFGSVLTMEQAFQNVVRWLTTGGPGNWHRMHQGYSFDNALILASQICSTNAARLIGCYETVDNMPGRGDIQTGKRADLVIFSGDSAQELKVDSVFLAGELVS